jgi:hypothetical protein
MHFFWWMDFHTKRRMDLTCDGCNNTRSLQIDTLFIFIWTIWRVWSSIESRIVHVTWMFFVF